MMGDLALGLGLVLVIAVLSRLWIFSIQAEKSLTKIENQLNVLQRQLNFLVDDGSQELPRKRMMGGGLLGVIPGVNATSAASPVSIYPIQLD